MTTVDPSRSTSNTICTLSEKLGAKSKVTPADWPDGPTRHLPLASFGILTVDESPASPGRPCFVNVRSARSVSKEPDMLRQVPVIHRPGGRDIDRARQLRHARDRHRSNDQDDGAEQRQFPRPRLGRAAVTVSRWGRASVG